MKTTKRRGFAAVLSAVMITLFSKLTVYADLAPIPPEEPEPLRIWPALLITAVVIIALVLYFRYRK
jgi:FtsH-binding integral membrane protein